MPTMWDLVSQRLEFKSSVPSWGNSTSVTAPGAYLLEPPEEHLPDRCVYDPNLLDALEHSVRATLTPIHATDDFCAQFYNVQQSYDEENRLGTDLSSEVKVRRFLEANWFRKATRVLDHVASVKNCGISFRFDSEDTARHQQPDFKPQLKPSDQDDWVNVSLIELKSEGIARRFGLDVLERGKNQVALDWYGTERWDMVDKILLKIAAYLASYNLTWLCWTAASQLIVFRIVRKPAQKPYLVMSDIVQVDDTREHDPSPIDKRIGERWMISVIGCCLAGLAASQHGTFNFDVEDITSVIGEPAPTPGQQDHQDNNLDRSPSPISTDSTEDPSWTTNSGRQRENVTAVLAFCTQNVPRGLAAPLVESSFPSAKAWHHNSARGKLHSEFWGKNTTSSSQIPLLALHDRLGVGSTGVVYAGSWKGSDVAVKIAEGPEARERLRSESAWYAWLSRRDGTQCILPTYFGMFQHFAFDVLVLSQEGHSLRSWDDLRMDERHHLFSLLLRLHQAGLRHGDIEPRNVLRSATGQIRLIDLTEASQHRCRETAEDAGHDPHKRHRAIHGFCFELNKLLRALNITIQ